MLEKEFKFYLDNQETFVKEYKGKYISIVGESITGNYSSEEEAYIDSSEKYKPGTFLIILCEPGESSYTQSFHSRVVFS